MLLSIFTNKIEHLNPEIRLNITKTVSYYRTENILCFHYKD
jgi:hypothetical protein